jgi:hypothetical protein
MIWNPEDKSLHHIGEVIKLVSSHESDLHLLENALGIPDGSTSIPSLENMEAEIVKMRKVLAPMYEFFRRQNLIPPI